MNPEVKKALLKRLRDEKNYDIARNTLCVATEEHDGRNCMCPLGMIADAFIEEHPNADWKPFERNYAIDQNEFGLPERVVKWAGLDHPRVKMKFNDKEVTLVELNDQMEMPRDVIADLVEAQL